MSKNDKSKLFVGKTNNSSKCSIGHVEWFSYNPFGKFSTQGQKTYTHCQKVEKKTKIDHFFFAYKWSHEQIKRSFANALGVTLPKIWHYYGQCPTLVKKLNFFPIFILPENVPKNFQNWALTNPTKTLWENGGNISFHKWNRQKKIIYPKQ